jgi:hypothetical protein
MTTNILLLIVLVLVCTLWWRDNRGRHYNLLHLGKIVLLALACALVTIAVAHQFGMSNEDARLLFGGTFVFVLLIFPKRRRDIPNGLRREVIAEWEAETGQKFDGGVHELNHKIPFSEGGGHTKENLRVLPRQENREKGKKPLDEK